MAMRDDLAPDAALELCWFLCMGYAEFLHPLSVMNPILSAVKIKQTFDHATQRWHEEDAAALYPTTSLQTLDAILLELHRANFNLWHEEDKARDPAATDAQIATVKRTIDKLNQRRNDLVEQCDRFLLDALAKEALPNPDAPLHSETPGLILDRLSILSLKIYHTQEEVDRRNAPTGHRERNQERFAILQAQREDLAHCLEELWSALLQGKRRFKLYRQLKMYNDPSLNPVLYSTPRSS
ncbi:MAG: DUF4254 domain-containing protein [Acidobacteriaceae bacterium]